MLALGVLVEIQEVANDGVTVTRHLRRRTGQDRPWSDPLKWLGAIFWTWLFLHIVFGVGPNYTRRKDSDPTN